MDEYSFLINRKCEIRVHYIAWKSKTLYIYICVLRNIPGMSVVKERNKVIIIL